MSRPDLKTFVLGSVYVESETGDAVTYEGENRRRGRRNLQGRRHCGTRVIATNDNDERGQRFISLDDVSTAAEAIAS